MGALTLKSFPFELRGWDIEKFKSIDPTDGFGRNTRVYVSNEKIVQIEPEYDLTRNDTWLSDKGRQFFDGIFAFENRTKNLTNKTINEYSWKKTIKALLRTFYLLEHCTQKQKISFTILFENVSIEILSLLMIISNSYSFIDVKRVENVRLNNDLESNFQINSGLNEKKLTTSSLCLLIGSNPRYESYSLNLELRQRFLKGDFITDLLYLCPFMALRAWGIVLFEVSYDIFLTHHMNRQARGKVLAYLQIALLLSGLLAPILGAWLAATFGIQAASYAAVGFFMIAGGVLLLTPDEKVKIPYSPKKLTYDTLFKTPKALYISQAGWVFQDAVLWLIWPIFLTLIVQDLLSMSLLVGLASFLSMLVAYFMGRTIDKKAVSPVSLLRKGSIRGTAINLGRAVSFSPLVVLAIDFAYKVNWQSISVPHDNEIFKWLHERDTYERSHIRWWIVEGLYIVPLAICGLLFYFIPGEPQWLFIIIFLLAGLSMLGTMEVTKLNQR